jgi:hypothetical protein
VIDDMFLLSHLLSADSGVKAGIPSHDAHTKDRVYVNINNFNLLLTAASMIA